MAIRYQIEPDLSAVELGDVFTRSGIRRPVDELPRLAQMVAKADLIITAREGDLLVGVARSLTDFCFACYLSDLAVDVKYQRMGVGRSLVQQTRDAIGEGTMLLLIAAPEAMDYYGRIGFERMNRAWWINRRK